MSHLHDKVSGLVDGELAGPARARALSHLRRCAACRREVTGTLAVKRRLGGLAGAEPPADLLDALGSLRPPTTVTAPAPEPGRAGRRVLAGAATMSVALIGVAYAVGTPEDAPAARVTPPVEQFTADFADATSGAPLSDPAVGSMGDGGSALTVLAVGQATGPLVAGTTSVRQRGDQPRAVGLLEAAVDAARRVAYTGERRVAVFDGVGPSIVTVAVAHVPGQGTSFDLSGLGNEAATFVGSQDADRSAEPGVSLDILVDTFDLAVTGSGWVAHRPATVVTASRAGEPVARFWIDDRTGLLIRRDLYAEGQLARTSQFTSLEPQEQSFMPHLPPELSAPSASTMSMRFAPSLNDDGWACPEQLADGYRLVGLRSLPAGGVQATYTDGLSTASVFEQRGALDPRGLHGFAREQVTGSPVYVRDGLPSIAVWESDGTIYSVVTDAPDAMTAHVVESLPHDGPDATSATERVATGLARMASFVTPG